MRHILRGKKVCRRVCGATDLKRSIKYLSISVVLIRLSQLTSNSGADTGKAAMPKYCYFALHSSIERRVRQKKPVHNTDTSVKRKIAHNNNVNFVFPKELSDFYNYSQRNC